MTTETKFQSAFVLILVAVIGVFGAVRYSRRPPFAGGFYVIGRGFNVMYWRPDVSFGVPGHDVFIDNIENVLLLVPVDKDHNVEWVPNGLVGSDLLLQHLPDPRSKLVEWRRDCLIVVDDQGSPQYFSLPLKEFRAVLGNPFMTQADLEKLLKDTIDSTKLSSDAGEFISARTSISMRDMIRLKSTCGGENGLGICEVFEDRVNVPRAIPN